SSRLPLANRYRIDDRLDCALDLGMAQHEEEFRGAISGKLMRVDVLEDVDAVLGQEDLVHLERTRSFLTRKHFQSGVVCADGHHTLVCQELGTFHAQSGLTTRKALVVLADEAEPAGVEQDDVALADL